MNISSDKIRIVLTLIFAGSLLAVHQLMYPHASRFATDMASETASVSTLLSRTTYFFLFLAAGSLAFLLFGKQTRP